jgi:hypothetical protein
MLETLRLDCQYSWKPAYLRERVEYFFPADISPFMRNQYKGPAVFRWLVSPKPGETMATVYIGEAQEMCPKRLYGYLNPAPTQAANKKVNTDFREYLKDKRTVRLDLLDVQEFLIGGLVTETLSLQDKYARRLLVAAQIIIHQKQGYTIVDL